MLNYEVAKWFVLLLVLATFSSAQDPYASQPRFATINGHLQIISAQDRNISFRTSGGGQVYLNNENLLQIVKKARTSNRFLESFKLYELPDIRDKLGRYSEYLEGTHGLLQKMARIEAGSVNGTSIAGVFNGTSPPTFGTLSNLERTVRRLVRDMNRLKRLLQADECASNPCRNGGSCIDHFNGYQCQCPDSWEGVLCDADVDECSLYANTHLACQNGGTCVNKPGYYDCHCPPGFYGVLCKEKTNSCAQRGDDLCKHGICVDHKDGYKCICDQGWTTDGTLPACVVDVNECQTHFSCSKAPPVECVNTPGSYRCGACPLGYTGNGHYCNDIDECLVDNGGCSKVPLVPCLNLPGSAVCAQCPAGYSGDGATCQYLGGPCLVNNGGCHPKASCMQNLAISENYVQCVCPAGYVGSGVGPSGCVASGLTPINATSCPSSRCNNHGICTYALDSSFRCLCEPGYTGSFCEITVNPCSPNPCLNRGTCARVVGDPRQFQCLCPSGFGGNFCQIEQEVCRGVFTNSSGVLSFPETPNTTYPHDSNCAWIIKTNISSVLNVSFEYLALESSLDCKIDWLQINDGPDTTHNLIGRYCGTTKPKNFTSSSNSIHVWFRSDSTTTSAGFKLRWTSVRPKCGGTIKDITHGTISSPGSPRRYPTNRDCYWHLKVPKGYRILFTFFTLMIGTAANCTNDYLEIINGYEDFNEPMERLCGANFPPPVYSASSTATLHFHSDNKTGTDEVGFQLTYAAVRSCGGLLNAYTGTITSPNHPEKEDEYIPNTVCEWTIQLPPSERVILHFVMFDLEDSDNCTYDHVEIFDGANFDSPLLGKFCGSKKTILPIVSTKNVVSVRFTTDLSNAGSGFRIKYDLLCGGEFTAETGHFNSPLFPNYYPGDKRCTYLLSQPPGKAIEVKFIEFEIETSSDDSCTLDYLKAYDGENENATLIGTYCSGNRPDTIISKHNYLLFVFETDSTISRKGFYANFTAIDVVCGGIFKANSSTITSPKHPSKYPKGQTCQWVISAPPGYFIQLTWSEFSLESHSQCRHDYVEIFDNSSLVAQNLSVGRFCGFKLPPPVTSTGNIMTVLFVSDASISADGFAATYQMLDGTRMCGGNYFATTGYIRTPNYPGRYPYNRNCVWTITVPPGQQIRLHVKNFTLEPNKFCHYDYLEIRQGGYETSPLIGKYCGYTSPPNITSHGNQLYFKFVSDATTNMDGFNIYWDGTSTGCGGILTSSTGSITSPNYPNSYGLNANCFWKISINKGSQIKLTIIDIDLDSVFSPKCYNSYIHIFDGNSAQSPSLGQFCRTGQQALLKSTSNEMYIRFRASRRFDTGKGFFLQYSSVCNVTLTGFTGVIESPNFPEMYPRQTNCMWIIKAPLGNRVNISFSHFNLKGGPFDDNTLQRPFWPTSVRVGLMLDRNCSDFVEIKEASSEETDPTLVSKSLGKFCGKTLPKMVSSTEDTVYVQFKSFDIFPGTGFRLEWMVHGCGGIFVNKQRGKFATPNYPNHYPPKIQCDWYFTADWDKQVSIGFPTVDIENDMNNCDMDSITIYSGEDDKAPVLERICQSQSTPIIVHAHGNKALVRFVSDMSYSGRGFEGSFTVDKGGCGGLFKAISGSIFSPNYPKNYKDGDECQWLISVKENHRVNLTFTDFDVGVARSNVNCSNSYVDILDGFTDIVSYRLCGSTLQNKYFLSTGSAIVVRLRARSPTTKGFAANYTSACGATIETDDSGILSSDTSVIAHQESFECDWIIKAKKPESKITFTVTHINLNTGFSPPMDDTSCSDDTLQIFDGDDTNTTKLLDVCGTSIPLPVISSGPFMLVRFRLLSYAALSTKHMFKFSGFYSVRSTVCGGTLTSEIGTISSPNYPNGYPRVTDCVWTITASQGNKMQLVFSNFNLLNSDSCHEDYVEIREGDVAGKLLSVSCGDTKPGTITASHAIWVKFHSGGKADTTAKGFTADFALLNHNELKGPSGTITSPLYPLVYTFDKVFTWRILVESTQSVKITFNECSLEKLTSDDEAIDSDDSTISDLKIYDGFDDTAPLLTTVTGFSCPKPIIASSSYAYIIFRSNMMYTGSSFRLSWSAIPLEADSIDRKTSNKTCSEDIFLSTSPTGITNYTFDRNLTALEGDCTWQVRSEEGSHITLKFDKVNFYKSPYLFSCTGGVTVYEGTPSNEWKFIKNLCTHNSTGTVIEGTNLMKMEISIQQFWDVNSNGLLVTATEVCGGLVDEPNGVLEVGNKTMMTRDQTKATYFYQKLCEWTIAVKPGRTIKFSYPQFSVLKPSMPIPRNGKECDKVFVLIKNGQDDDYPPLGNGKYCNNTVVNIPETTGNKAFVRFVVPSTDSVGLKLAYREVAFDCSEEYRLSDSFKSINITSPQYPDAPLPHTECVWKFSAPPHESIRITFPEQFDFTWTDGCKDDYVEVRDGLTEVSRLIGRYCSNTFVPNSLFSTGNQLMVKYFTDVRNPKNGFLATVDMASCGGTYKVYYGKDKVTSPGYPNAYAQNLNCNTTLITSMDSYFSLNFTAVNLLHPGGRFDFNDKRGNLSCTGDGMDVVVVYNVDPVTFRATELARACRHVVPPPFESSSNRVLVAFSSKNNPNTADSDALHAGFVLEYTATYSTCDGTFTTPYGNISSPNYPQKPDRAYHCTWRIEAPKGRRVTVTIVRALFLSTEGALKPLNPERLKFYNDRYYSSRIVTLSGPQTPGTKVESSSNFMLISYTTSRPITFARGFLLNYTTTQETLCDSTLDASGVIKSPEMNGTSFYCIWERLNPSTKNQTFVITISGITSPFQRNVCSTWNALSIYSFGDRITNRICSYLPNATVTVRSPYSKTRIKAMISEKDWFISGTWTPVDFRINYTTTSCGGVVDDTVQAISSPNYPDPYDDQSDCAWFLDFGGQIKLMIETVDLEPDCKVNFLRIYNGHSSEDPLLKEYCGSVTNEALIVHYSTFIEFHSESNNNGKKGFRMRIAPTVNDVCSGLVVGTTGEIASPKYPGMYPSLLSCTWEIEVPPGYHVGLAFIDRFYLEDSANCTKDFVMVYDHGQKKEDKTAFEVGDPPTQKFCGRNHPPVFNSTYRWMTIRFQSDSDKAGEGFKAEWRAVCGGVFREPEGTIVSPNYPESYNEQSNCNYTIFAPGKVISLEFLSFELEAVGPGGCPFSNLTIYAFESQYTTSLTPHETYCGTTLPPKQVFKSMVSLVLRSDDFAQAKGFVIKYQTQGCGGIIMDAPATISSIQPGGNNNVLAKCQWNITAPVGQIVLIQFTKLQLQKSPYCFINAVKLYNGLDPQNLTSEIAQICDESNENLRVIKSASNKMAVVFRGYVSQENGFEANVFFSLGEQEGCGGRKYLNSSSSLNLDFAPADTSLPLSCEWKIFGREDDTIQLTFKSVTFSSCDYGNASTSHSCDCNRLLVYDGINVQDENLITMFCNSTSIPLPLVSSGNSLLVVYTMTQRSNLKPRLSIKLERKPSICGPTQLNVTNQTSVLTSPGWPQPYLKNIRCIWHLSFAGLSGYIDIHITDLDIAPSPQCKNDYLQLSEDSFHSAQATYCESEHSKQRKSITDYYSRGSSMKIMFVTSGVENSRLDPGPVRPYKGFRLEYREAGCNRNYTRDYGQFQLDSTGSSDCVITIRSTNPNATLAIYFSIFLMYQKSGVSCADHKVTVWDGLDESTKPIRTLCQSDYVPNPIFASGSSVKLKYQAKNDESSMLTLDLSYTSTTLGRGCGGYFYSNTGSFTSPMYPEVTRNESLCQWTIVVPEGNIVQLTFSDFDLGPQSTCETNYMNVYDVSPTSNQEIFARKYCGRDEFTPYVSTSNRVVVESKTNANRAGPGWRVNFRGIGKKTSSAGGGVVEIDYYE